MGTALGEISFQRVHAARGSTEQRPLGILHTSPADAGKAISSNQPLCVRLQASEERPSASLRGANPSIPVTRACWPKVLSPELCQTSQTRRLFSQTLRGSPAPKPFRFLQAVLAGVAAPALAEPLPGGRGSWAHLSLSMARCTLDRGGARRHVPCPGHLTRTYRTGSRLGCPCVTPP